INGQSVAVDAQGNFRTKVRPVLGVNVVDARLKGVWGGDAQRAFVYGKVAAPDASIQSGVLLRANAPAFGDKDSDLDDFSAIGRALLLQADVGNIVKQQPPVHYDFVIGSLDAVVTDAKFEK